jgi:hypothetical protein
MWDDKPNTDWMGLGPVYNAPVPTYESVLLAHGFHPEPSPYGTRYIVPDGDFGFNIARKFPGDKAVQIVTAFMSRPEAQVREIVNCNPKWDVLPGALEALIPELYAWAAQERKEQRGAA